MIDTGPLNRTTTVSSKVDAPVQGAFEVPVREIPQREILRLNRSLVAMQSALSSIGLTLDSHHIVETAVWEIVNLIQADAGAIYELKGEEKALVQQVSFEPGSPIELVFSGKNTLLHLTEDSSLSHLLQDGYAQHYQVDGEQATLPPELDSFKKADCHELLAVPLLYQDFIFGVVFIISRNESRRFSNQDIALVQMLGNHTAAALTNARFYARAEKSLKVQEILRGASTLFFSTLDQKKIFRLITEQMSLALDVSNTYLCQIERRTNQLRVVGEYISPGASPQEVFSINGLIWDISIWGEDDRKFLQEGQPRPWHFHGLNPASPFHSHLQSLEGRSILCVPLTAAGKTTAVAFLCDAEQTRLFSSEEIMLAHDIAQQGAIAAENARLYEQAQREIMEQKEAEKELEQEKSSLTRRIAQRTAELTQRYRSQRALATIEPSINQDEELDKLVQQVVDIAEDILEVDGGAIIFLTHPAEKTLKRVSSGLLGEVAAEATLESFQTSPRLLGRQEMVSITDRRNADDPDTNWLQGLGLQSLLGMPIKGQRQILGLIYICSRSPRAYRDDELDFLRALTHRIGVALTNVNLFKRLQETNQELSRVARLKDEFLASMSHELRTPLNAIIGISEGLRDEFHGPLNEKQVQSVQILEESGRHLLTLISDILDVAKIESGKLTLQLETTNVPNLVRTCQALVASAAEKKNIELIVEIDPQVRYIQADPTRIKQILLNLLDNGLKFTPNGRQVGLKVQGSSAEDLVQFIVWDQGVGIAQEDQVQLFEPFVQLDRRLSREYPGTGLGLSIVRKLIELHHGTIHLESQVDEGSSFIVTIPWHQDAAPKQERVDRFELDSSNPLVTPLEFTASLQPNILLLSHDFTTGSIIREFLQNIGCHITTAASIDEGLVQVKQQPPHLIIVDELPTAGISVSAVVASLRSSETTDIPIVVQTDESDVAIHQKLISAGAYEIVTRPISLKKLKKIITTVIETSINHPL